MGEEYEALGPAKSGSVAPPPLPDPGQPGVFQFSPAAPPLPSPQSSTPGERTQQLSLSEKRSEMGNQPKTEKKADGKVNTDTVCCMVAALILIIMLFIGIALVIFLILLVKTKCFGKPECTWLKVFKFF
ncbi:unnamed protein product [Litomosoides sigmodontis]|uniref:Uncharacterized protein n=1 Tax=Litomosoides sigmodontis TaxID=42156 RepID=A0A3P6T3B0_LITSI|nr:unnamed protein product [Litomosoides sigmodontis]